MQSDSAKPLSESIPNSVLDALAAPKGNRHARRAYRHVEKTFSREPVTKLTEEQRRAIMEKAWAIADAREPGKHSGPLTLKDVRVLQKLLWQFHNKKNGWCFPSYELIAKAAHCAVSTVALAIQRLKECGLLTWTQGIKRATVTEFSQLLGEWIKRKRVFRASNRYRPIPQEKPKRPSKSDYRSGRTDQGPNHYQQSGKTEEIEQCELSLAHFRELFEARLARAGPK
jgi:hypothetical protein